MEWSGEMGGKWSGEEGEKMSGVSEWSGEWMVSGRENSE